MARGVWCVYAAGLVACAGLPAAAQMRVANWNVSNYNGTGREAAFKTSVYGVYNGRSMAPDVLIVQEFTSATAVANFRAILNTAAGSPGDWQAAPFIDGPDSDSAFFYRAGKVSYLGSTVVVPGGNMAGAPRHVIRYDARPIGYSSAGATVACYSVHMKAGSTTEDQNRRLAEATLIRADSNALPAGWSFLLAGDTNMQSSTQSAYQMLIGSQSNNRGRFFDPINTSGAWNNSSAFRFVHTQAPGSGGQMDDRFDFILLSDSLSDGADFDYVGNRSAAYSTSTWNDPNHSFRAWGNDGSSYDTPLTVSGNAMVGPAIAQALADTQSIDASGGHLPVFMDVRVPAKLGAPAAIDLGQVQVGAAGTVQVTITNEGDVGIWGATGVAPLQYTLASSPNIFVPPGSSTAQAGGTGNQHLIAIDTSAAGPFAGTLTVNTSSVEHPTRVIPITATVVGATCYANCDGSTSTPVLNVLDFNCFLNRFSGGESYANCDGSTGTPVLNVLDFNCFLNAFSAGCR